MNRLCPPCETNLLEVDETVPFQEDLPDDAYGALHFCSDECRDEFVDAFGEPDDW